MQGDLQWTVHDFFVIASLGCFYKVFCSNVKVFVWIDVFLLFELKLHVHFFNKKQIHRVSKFLSFAWRTILPKMVPTLTCVFKNMFDTTFWLKQNLNNLRSPPLPHPKHQKQSAPNLGSTPGTTLKQRSPGPSRARPRAWRVAGPLAPAESLRAPRWARGRWWPPEAPGCPEVRGFLPLDVIAFFRIRQGLSYKSKW